MPFTRTRIWRGGRFELEGDAPEPGSVPLTPVPESPRREPPSHVAPASIPVPAGQAPNADYIPGFAPNALREQAATRFMPIEELFPELAADAAQRAASANEPAYTSRPERALIETPTGLRGTHQRRARRWPILVLAVVSLALGTSLWSRDVRVELSARLARAGAVSADQKQREPSRHRAERDAAKTETIPGATAPVHGVAPATERAAARVATAHTGSSQSLAPGLERATIDALIAGDFARAEQLYVRLARGNPPEAIREALRILSSRHDARAP